MLTASDDGLAVAAGVAGSEGSGVTVSGDGLTVAAGTGAAASFAPDALRGVRRPCPCARLFRGRRSDGFR